MTNTQLAALLSLLANIVGIWLATGLALGMMSARTGKQFFALLFFWPFVMAWAAWKARK